MLHVAVLKYASMRARNGPLSILSGFVCIQHYPSLNRICTLLMIIHLSILYIHPPHPCSTFNRSHLLLGCNLHVWSVRFLLFPTSSVTFVRSRTTALSFPFHLGRSPQLIRFKTQDVRTVLPSPLLTNEPPISICVMDQHGSERHFNKDDDGFTSLYHDPFFSIGSSTNPLKRFSGP